MNYASKIHAHYKIVSDLRPKTLCVFDVIYSRGQGYVKDLISMEQEDALDAVKQAGEAFGNLGITLSDSDASFVLKKVHEYWKNKTKFASGDLNTPDTVAPDNPWLEFRRTFK